MKKGFLFAKKTNQDAFEIRDKMRFKPPIFPSEERLGLFKPNLTNTRSHFENASLLSAHQCIPAL